MSRDAIAIAGLLAGPHDGKPLSKEELRGRWKQIRQNVAGADDRRADKKHAQVLAGVDDLNRRKKAQEEAISANSTAVALGE